MLRRITVNGISLISLLILTAASFYVAVPWYFFLAILLFWFLLTLGGSFFIRWNYHLNALHSKKDTAKNQVSISFDDGPDPVFTPKVLALLRTHNAKASFFCIGQCIEAHPEIFQSIIDQGHSVGNHTFSHSKSFGFFKTEKVISELHKTREIVKRLIGKEMQMYRPAFGVTNPMIARAVQHLKLHCIGWNVRSLDTTARTEKMILKRISRRVSKGDVILLHDTSQKTVDVLEQLLLFLEKKNLEVVSVDQLLEIDAYA